MTADLTNYVFMSYSRQDEAVMQRIMSFLHNEGIHVWLDHERLTPGTPIWEEEIEKAIVAAAAVVVVMSPDSKDSEWVRREISLADQHRKRIFPLLVRGNEDASITLRLITRQFVDLRQNEEAGLKSLFVGLSSYLQEMQADSKEESRTERVEREFAASAVPHLEKAGPHEKQDSDSITKPGLLLWITLGFAVSGAMGGFLFSEYAAAVGGLVGGAIGGLIIPVALRGTNILSAPKNMLLTTLGWGIGGAIGWFVGDQLTEAIGMALGHAIIAAVGLVSILRFQSIRIQWVSMAWVILAWAIGGAIGWSIGRYIQLTDAFDIATGWAIGHAIGWAIGGFVLGRQIMKSGR